VSQPQFSPTPKQFEDRFINVIRVGFNWDRFLEEQWPVELVHLTNSEDLHRCFMPWYIGPNGEEVAYDDPNAAPLRLTDVPKSMHILSEERKADVIEKVEEFRQERDIITFSAPTYALPDNQYFVLDRNHRLSALTLNPVSFDVTLWNVRGPLESDSLLDLEYWLPHGRGHKP
jgi:hypothetical protein